MKKKTGRKFSKTDFVSVLFGWAYIAVAVSLIALLLVNARPEGRLVCDKKMPWKPMTGFGACHEELPER